MFIGTRSQLFGIPGKLFGAVRGRGAIAGGLTSSLKGSVSAGATLAGSLTLKRALVGAVVGGATLGANLSGGAGTLRGSIPSNAVLLAKLTKSLRGAVGPTTSITGALSLKRALAGNLFGGATFTSALTAGSALKLVTHGDSITSTSQPSSDPTQYYGAVLNGLISSRQGASYTLVRQGIGGQSWNYVWPSSGSPNTLIQDAVINIDPHVGPNNILVAYAGTNGIQLGGHSAATEAADADAYMAARIAAGWTPSNIYMVSLLPRENMLAKTRNAFNRALQAYCATRGCKFVAIHDLYDLGRTTPSDTTYYYDQVHPTVYSHSLIAETIYDKMYATAWTPAQIASMSGTSLALWLDAQDATTMFSDAGVTQATSGQNVQQWNDKSGNGRHVSQATLGSRPTLSTVFGKPALSFSGSFLENTSLSSFPTALNVGALWAPSGNSGLFDTSSGTGGYEIGNGGLQPQSFNGASGDAGGTAASAGKMRALLLGTGQYTLANGSSSFSVANNNALAANTSIKIGNCQGLGMSGPIGEFIVFGGTLRSVDARRFADYMMNRWGVDAYADDYAFTDLTGQAQNTTVTSNTITLSGIGANNQVRLMTLNETGTGGSPQVSVNGGAFASIGTNGIYVSNGDTIQIQMTTAAAAAATSYIRVEIGKDQYFWSVTTA